MKKLLSLLLSLALILTLAACGNTPDTPATPADDVAVGGVTDTIAETGGDGTADTAATETVTDASGEPVTRPDGKPVTAAATTKPTAGSGSASATGRTYAEGKTTKSTQKATQKTTAQTVTAQQKLVDDLFTLSTGQSRSDITLTGVVTYVKEAYTDRYDNATFEIEVDGVDRRQTLLCYRCSPADGGATEVAVGQTVTLSGTVQNYKGTIEFYPATYQIKGGTAATAKPTAAPTGGDGAIDPDGVYDSKDEVALYVHTYGCLPKNYVTKSQYKSQGKPRDKCCGGDRFYNNEGLLPSGYTYYECDIDTLGTTNRGAKRLVWTTSGIVYYTSDHYESFTKLYGER